jgi:hypothetical protein
VSLRALCCLCLLGCAGETLGPIEPDAAEEADAGVQQPRPDARPAPDAPVGVPDAPLPVVDAAVPADARADAAAGADARPDAGTTTTACLSGAGVTAVPSSTVFHDHTFAGASNQYVFNTNQCGDMPDSAERIYGFQLATPTEWYAETRCDWDCELVLTRDGCSDPDVVACETTVGDEVMSGTLQPGRYALFVEGDNPDDPAVFDLMVNFHRTAGQLQCEATALAVIDPANCEDPVLDDPHYRLVLDDDTSPADVDDFFVQDVDGCTHDQGHVGGAPDKVYSLTLPGTRDVEIVLAPGDWDGMLYVTGTPCGARAQVLACSDDAVGSEEEVDVTLGAGTWYIVVDGFGETTFDAGSWGAFSLEVRVYDDACND